MKIITLAFVLGISGLVQSGCIAPAQSPVTSEDRKVTLCKNEKMTITVIDGIVMSDMLGSRGIRFPGGVYTLEGEDEVYRYFAAPAPLEYRVFQGGKPVDGRFIRGGLALAKQTLRMVPASAYMNSDGNMMTLTWKLGSEFLSQEGRRWKKSF